MGYMHIDNLYKDQTILMFRECYALEKIHGCLHADTIIETVDGKKTIKDICIGKYTGKIKSFDVNNNKYIWKQITNHWIGDETEDWYRIETQYSGDIIATGNHMFWLPQLKCWRRADLLKSGDIVMTSRKNT